MATTTTTYKNRRAGMSSLAMDSQGTFLRRQHRGRHYNKDNDRRRERYAVLSNEDMLNTIHEGSYVEASPSRFHPSGGNVPPKKSDHCSLPIETFRESKGEPRNIRRDTLRSTASNRNASQEEISIGNTFYDRALGLSLGDERAFLRLMDEMLVTCRRNPSQRRQSIATHGDEYVRNLSHGRQENVSKHYPTLVKEEKARSGGRHFSKSSRYDHDDTGRKYAFDYPNASSLERDEVSTHRHIHRPIETPDREFRRDALKSSRFDEKGKKQKESVARFEGFTHKTKYQEATTRTSHLTPPTASAEEDKDLDWELLRARFRNFNERESRRLGLLMAQKEEARGRPVFESSTGRLRKPREYPGSTGASRRMVAARDIPSRRTTHRRPQYPGERRHLDLSGSRFA